MPRAAGCADDIGRDSVVTLQRHSCDRRWLCPVYKLVLFGDGTVIYDGIYYVGRKGVIRDHIAPEAFRKLIDSANAIHYFTLKSDYGYHDTQACESRVPDSPLVTTSVTSGENSHGIIHHHRCAGAIPAQLTVFENEIDQAADTARWTK
ncbi:MAG TPA: DUF6438 domain-containing protein [Bryobacteraceae bacterium]